MDMLSMMLSKHWQRCDETEGHQIRRACRDVESMSACGTADAGDTSPPQ